MELIEGLGKTFSNSFYKTYFSRLDLFVLSQTCHFMRKRFMTFNLLLSFKFVLLTTCAEFGYKNLIIWLTQSQRVKFPKGSARREREKLMMAATKTDNYKFYRWIVKKLRFKGKISYSELISNDNIGILQGLRYFPDNFDIDIAFSAGSCKVLETFANRAEKRWMLSENRKAHPKSLEWLYNRGISIDDQFFSSNAWEVPEDSLESWGTWLWNASCQNWSYQEAVLRLLKDKFFSNRQLRWLLRRTPVTLEMLKYDFAIHVLWEFDPAQVREYLVNNNKQKILEELKEIYGIELEPELKKIKTN